MTAAVRLTTRLRECRVGRGWSQDELARRSGISRAGVSAIETGRLVPSAAAALALAAALGCTVEALFRLEGGQATLKPAWAWAPIQEPVRFWAAELDGQTLMYPAEPLPVGVVPHDGVAHADREPQTGLPEAARTLVIACCDPAVGLLVSELGRAAGVRVIAFSRSSRTALELLSRRLIHAAGIHLSSPSEPEGNASAARSVFGSGCSLLRMARWDTGIALASRGGATSVGQVLKSRPRWVGREEGSGARQCLDELLAGQQPPRTIARNHREVAELIRGGHADAGICLRLAAEEAGLRFFSIRQEAYDLCFPSSWQDDPRVQALVQAARTPRFRQLLGELPGYDPATTGQLETLAENP